MMFLHYGECVMRGNSHRAAERRPRRKTVFLEALVDTVNVTLACRRAFEGVERPVYYKGEQVGTWRFYSDALAMFLLKAHRPERYRGTATGNAAPKALSPEEQAAAAEKEEKEAEVRGYRAMFERVWAHSREEQDRELAAAGHEPRPYPSPPKLEDWA